MARGMFIPGEPARRQKALLLRVSMGQWIGAILSPLSALMRTKADRLFSVSGSLQTELPKQQLNAFFTEDFKSHVVSGGQSATTNSAHHRVLRVPQQCFLTSTPEESAAQEEIRGDGGSISLWCVQCV